MSTAKFDTLSNLAGTQTVPVATVAQGSAKAWVNFNGIGTVAIRASFNVSSITDNGTGNYTVNFTTALPDTNYGAATVGSTQTTVTLDTQTTTTSGLRVRGISGAEVDVSIVCAAYFR